MINSKCDRFHDSDSDGFADGMVTIVGTTDLRRRNYSFWNEKRADHESRRLIRAVFGVDSLRHHRHTDSQIVDDMQCSEYSVCQVCLLLLFFFPGGPGGFKFGRFHHSSSLIVVCARVPKPFSDFLDVTAVYPDRFVTVEGMTRKNTQKPGAPTPTAEVKKSASKVP